MNSVISNIGNLRLLKIGGNVALGHGISPPSLRGGLKIFGKISLGGPGNFPKIRDGTIS